NSEYDEGNNNIYYYALSPFLFICAEDYEFQLTLSKQSVFLQTVLGLCWNFVVDSTQGADDLGQRVDSSQSAVKRRRPAANSEPGPSLLASDPAALVPSVPTSASSAPRCQADQPA